MQPVYNDCVFLHKRQVVSDAYIDLNGAELSTIVYAGNVLESGRDYMVSEGKLTLKSRFLLSLPSHPLGEVAMLCCHFADGAVREVRVFQLDILEAEERIGEGAKPGGAVLSPIVKRRAVGFAIGGAGVLAAAIATRVIMAKRKK
ncbi:MAG: hypothetical protein FWD03_06505 [Defluviitaleaceae bacterium]|nr:hypothetical protein [Defluviitaleaceae bacterium]